ncbi:unnamed protein product [Ectocarpus sp. CCAP 1310/34]|nr:unnamed protein product [Ectocarpus sp. CCAP 1310/34]
MGPISLPALGGFRYVNKLVDEKTKWKETFLMKTKRDAIKALQLFNQSLVVPTRFRLDCLRGDKGTECTCREFREYCLQIGAKLEYASTNTPQQMGANERAGRTLAAMVRCILTDSGLPQFLWGQLMQTAAYLSNRVPHAALGNITPYKALYGKDANLGHLRAIGARAFVHVETHTRNLDSKVWESRIVNFIETPYARQDLTPSNMAGNDEVGLRSSTRVPDHAGMRSTAKVDKPSLTNQSGRDTAVKPKTIRELRRLALYTDTPLADVGHREERFDFLEYAFVANNTQIHGRSEGEKVKTIPNTCKKAMELPETKLWKAATDKEIKSLQDLKVYKLVPRTDVPLGHNVIGSKWVFKVKPENTHKARLVAKGWNQVPGRDCGGTFAPVCRLQSIRMVFAIAAEKDLDVIQLDVKTAFLYADIEENVFVEMAPGYEAKNMEELQLVMKLEKSLDGLAQSPQDWLKTIDSSLVEIGFFPLKSDTCVYIYDHNNTVVVLTLYVDDLLIIRGGAHHQPGNYTTSILDRFGMGSCKPLSTAGFGPELSVKQPEETLLNAEGKQRYQAIIGSVMYLAQVTRYDIMYCASQFARAMSNPSKIHMGAAKHLLRYLSGSRDFSITYKRGGFDLTASSNANGGHNTDNGKSMSSYIMMMSTAPASLKSGLQSLTAMSTVEAELVASALAMKEVIFCTNMMKELGFGSEFSSAPLFIDSTATLNVIGNQTFSGHTKHMALRFFYIRKIVKEGRISIHYIPTEDNLADIGTEYLNKQRHQYLIDKIKNFGK